MLWARVIRGTSSSANTVAPRSAASRQPADAESGSHMPTITTPDRSRSRSEGQPAPVAPQVRTVSRQSAANASSLLTIAAPAAR